ncbi:MAG: metallophosphoesterase [Acidobacteria bacterium]|jgi:predicted MPP superfamily phosphohydrolase|nr:MAG: metallophosphoesterase [Acidobacteriales bacterium 13_1_40CM_3_55_5]PYX04002.1 MAG: metallophosphoesterase [Acidobacteriota bacterium]PYX14826.1 MAG: metallophosphoesterase [Acidobacteriota bacterium]
MHQRVLFLILACAQVLGYAAQDAARVVQSTSAAANASAPQPAAANGLDIRLPLQSKSIRFAVIGDSGTGDRDQYQVAQEMETYRQKVGFDFVIMLGDNIYGSHHPNDFTQKFELPYKPMLDAGVKFYAALGNHDDPNDERLYKPFNMGGERYYAFKKGDVAFFALDSNYMDPNQLSWIDQNLQNTKSKWKICYFHHPLYNEGRSHGPDLDLRTQLTPLFKRYGVNLVLSGHEHVYERIKPQDNIYYLVLGNSAKLMSKDLKSSDQMQKGFDSDRGFMLIEIGGDKLYFQVISRTGQTIDAGVFDRQAQPSATSATVH